MFFARATIEVNGVDHFVRDIGRTNAVKDDGVILGGTAFGDCAFGQPTDTVTFGLG
tara:strand:- start:275 stop:442 length:168 start_codon:yes stop_codon:yes gene_type:complete